MPDNGQVSDLPRKAARRTARLAALPLGYAGRNALGLGKRLGGKPAEAVMTDIQQRTAEQLFRTLGELKGGAMKFGQALSVLEAALPDEVAGPYRDQLTRLQDSAPPMPTQTVRDALARDLGPDWREQLVWLDGGPAAAASIGQVHKGRWHDGREVAVKVQYPGAGEALRSDLRQLARLARTVGTAGARRRDQAAGRGAAGPRRGRARLPPRGRGPDAPSTTPSPTTRTSWCPTWSRSARRCWSPSGSRAPRRWRRSSPRAPRRSATTTASCWCASSSPARLAPACCTPTRTPGTSGSCPARTASPGRLGVLDFGAVARLPDQGLPEAMGRLIRIAATEDEGRAGRGLRSEGFIKDSMKVDPELVLDYLGPFIEPTRVERFRFSREWMRGQFAPDQRPARAVVHASP